MLRQRIAGPEFARPGCRRVAEIIRSRYPRTRVEIVDSRELAGETHEVEVRDVEERGAETCEETASKKPVEALGPALLRMQTRLAFKAEGPLRGMVENRCLRTASGRQRLRWC